MGALDAGIPLPEGCVESANDLPNQLVCTGLYSSLLDKQTAPSVRPFAPAVWLWSDGADKQRWIQLPEGATIDTSRPDDWSFPVGTKAWKEFKHNGKRIETRFFHKVRADRWLRGTYVWNQDDSDAVLSFGGDLPVSDGVYHVPTQDECDQCHKGRVDRLLGFEAPLLGLPGAEGVTLAMLAAEGKLAPTPAVTSYQLPDDGTGLAAQALPWLHVNCGVSCHNPNPNSTGYITGMFLRLDANEVATGSSAGWNVLATTMNMPAKTPAFLGSTRIVPGSPEQSLLVRLASTRGTNQQMPPIGSKIVDEPHLAIVREWIRRLSPDGGVDGGTPLPSDAGVDLDASMFDATIVAPPADADVPVEDDAAAPEDALVPSEPVEDALVPSEPVEDAQAPSEPVEPVEPAPAPEVVDMDAGV